MSEQEELFKKHKNTTFINAHLGWMGNNLDKLGSHLDKFPNVVTEMGAVLAELGRQPIRARKFLIDYQDRVLFGKDAYNISEYFVYFRFLKLQMNILIIIVRDMLIGKCMDYHYQTLF